ncbi:hypothetical protein TNIN_121881 [Trichonephila inaurata madagascariensis]|uniref:Uncharacterized protein n=1 Tax=Trichonephila inaurata madagascariensis TaxID=2747483 RepID=A0A8X7BPJ9_9ARAC|nr:hypothetical protein TNIN_121881 [Trichonephila inaurata madagascariensis]
MATRAFFLNPVIASSIIGIDEILSRKLHEGLTTMSCGHEIDVQKFKEFYLFIAELFAALCTWYCMPQSLHKVLILVGLFVNDSILPIRQMSEEGVEAPNQNLKYFHEHHSRKLNRQQSMEDMTYMLFGFFGSLHNKPKEN